ncbi:MAG: deoxyribose-phosphate aldolase [Microscillaceae bacterium]|jgi:deoxyribose-phosphate aldolase|nr:deoxyribose-phosphate aldolase [Microscillaceae bacterium]
MQNICEYIEHTNLNAVITSADVEQLVEEAQKYQFKGICVPPYWVKKARRDLGSTSEIRLVTVIGFPLGYNRSEVKLQEIKSAIREKADEFDVVINISAIKTNAFEWIKPELAQFAQLIHEYEGMMKVIIETAYLTDEEIIKTCKVCVDAGSDFIKTSTGFAPAGATAEHIRLIRQNAPAHVGVKASGGIKTLEQALAMIEAGADRLGTSSGVKIAEEWLQSKEK